MEIKLRLKSLPGYASKTKQNFELIAMNTMRKYIKEVYTDNDDTEIIWVIDAPSRKIDKLLKVTAMYDKWIRMMLDNKVFDYLLKEEDKPKLKDILSNHTQVELIKNSTADDIVVEGITLWERIKRTYKKVI